MWKKSSWRSSGCESSWPFHGTHVAQYKDHSYHFTTYPLQGERFFFFHDIGWFWNFLFFGKTLIVITNLIEGFLWLSRNYFLEGGSTLKLPWDWVVLKLPLRLFDNFKPDKPWLFAVPSPTWGKILDFLPFFEFNRRRVPRSQQLSWAKIQACVALTKNSQGIILTKVIYNVAHSVYTHTCVPTYVRTGIQTLTYTT